MTTKSLTRLFRYERKGKMGTVKHFYVDKKLNEAVTYKRRGKIGIFLGGEIRAARNSRKHKLQFSCWLSFPRESSAVARAIVV